MKIGIITHYYNSTNYGGLLQAYALCRFLNAEGHEAKQICYDRRYEIPFWSDYSFLNRQKYLFKRFLIINLKTVLKGGKKALLSGNAKKTRDFAINYIPHTSSVYNSRNLSMANREFDAFITGSDQVWHPNTVCGAYLLDFVESDKKKISYAASIAVEQLTQEQLKRYGQSLSSFSAISVREESGAEIVRPISPIDVEVVLDPTMLLEKEQWDEVCSPRAISDEYVFCYFLGNDDTQRECVKEFARSKGLKIASLSLNNNEAFGDIIVNDASPIDFVSYIKNAAYVFTDSFHATVFALLYKKEFVVFERKEYKSMGQRIFTLAKIFGVLDRFCDSDEKVCMAYIESLPRVADTIRCESFEEIKEKSINYLRKNL